MSGFPRDGQGRFLPRKSKSELEDHAVVVVTLSRETGKVTYEAWFSTPMETWAALCAATEIAADRLPHNADDA